MGYMGILLSITYPKPYSFYLRGTIGFGVEDSEFRVWGLGFRVEAWESIGFTGLGL